MENDAWVQKNVFLKQKMWCGKEMSALHKPLEQNFIKI